MISVSQIMHSKLPHAANAFVRVQQLESTPKLNISFCVRNLHFPQISQNNPKKPSKTVQPKAHFPFTTHFKTKNLKF